MGRPVYRFTFLWPHTLSRSQLDRVHRGLTYFNVRARIGSDRAVIQRRYNAFVSRSLNDNPDEWEPINSVEGDGQTEGEAYIHLYVKLYPDGAMSGALRSLTPGNDITIQGPHPMGNLNAPPFYKNLVLVAGGTGINPMIQLARNYVISDDQEAREARISIVWQVHALQDLYGLEKLEAMQLRFGRSLSVSIVVTNGQRLSDVHGGRMENIPQRNLTCHEAMLLSGCSLREGPDSEDLQERGGLAVKILSRFIDGTGSGSNDGGKSRQKWAVLRPFVKSGSEGGEGATVTFTGPSSEEMEKTNGETETGADPTDMEESVSKTQLGWRSLLSPTLDELPRCQSSRSMFGDSRSSQVAGVDARDVQRTKSMCIWSRAGTGAVARAGKGAWLVPEAGTKESAVATGRDGARANLWPGREAGAGLIREAACHDQENSSPSPTTPTVEGMGLVGKLESCQINEPTEGGDQGQGEDRVKEADLDEGIVTIFNGAMTPKLLVAQIGPGMRHVEQANKNLQEESSASKNQRGHASEKVDPFGLKVVCSGPAGFVLGVESLLAEIGVPKDMWALID
ncbi:unnamed protein product [Discosporangium mesarthrocarpum]